MSLDNCLLLPPGYGFDETIWTPASLSPVVWLKQGTLLFSDAGTTPIADTDPVYRWGDSSGNGNHANQATLGNRPIYSASNQWLTFSTDLLVISAASNLNFAAADPRTYTILMQVVASSTFGMFVARGDGKDEVRFNSSTGRPEATDSTDAAQSGSVLATSTTVLVSGVFGNTGQLQLWRNATLDASDATYSGVSVSGTNIAIGDRPSPSNAASIRVLEVAVYPARLTQADFTNLASYYGL